MQFRCVCILSRKRETSSKWKAPLLCLHSWNEESSKEETYKASNLAWYKDELDKGNRLLLCRSSTTCIATDADETSLSHLTLKYTLQTQDIFRQLKQTPRLLVSIPIGKRPPKLKGTSRIFGLTKTTPDGRNNTQEVESQPATEVKRRTKTYK